MARRGSNGKRMRRRGDRMRIPAALLALTAATTAAGDSIAELKSPERRARLVNGRRQLPNVQQSNQQQLQAPSNEQQPRRLQQSMCSCSPTVFHVRLDFSKDCNDDTLANNGGISATLCQLIDGAPPGMLPPPGPAPTLPPVTPDTPAPVAATTTTSTMAATTEPPVYVDDPFLPPRPDPVPPPPTPAVATPSPTAGTPDAPDVGAVPTDWPTWSPTATMWPSASTGANPGDGATDGEPVPTYAPTHPWPTYAPTPGIEKRSGVTEELARFGTPYLEAHKLIHGEADGEGDGELSKKQLKKQLKAGLSKEEVHDMKKKMRQDDKPNLLERYAGYHHSQMKAHAATLATNEPTASPTSGTPWPTDDETYAPTTTGHARNLEQHTLPGARRLTSGLSESSALAGGVVGEWTSVHPNDQFFEKYPEWKEMQEEIYNMRNGNGAGRRLNKREERKKLTGHHTHHEMVTTQDNVTVIDDSPEPMPSDVATTNVDGLLVPNQLLAAQFLELDASNDMNIINQDDQYLNVTFPPNDPSSPVTGYTLSFNSISALLDPSVPLEEQMDHVPGGVILIIIARTAGGEVIRNRLFWTYTMECGAEESVVVETGDVFGWAMFDHLTPPREEFCPNAPAPETHTPTVVGVPTSRPPTMGMPTRPPSTASKMPSTPSKVPSRPSPPSPPSPPTAPSKPSSSTSSTKAGKPHKPSSNSGGSASSKSGKALSMPSGDLLDQFDLGSSSKAAKPAKYSGQSSSSSASSASSHKSSKASSTKQSQSSSHSSHSSSRRQRDRRAEQREEEKEVFGRRISKHKESHHARREGVLFSDEGKRLRRRRA